MLVTQKQIEEEEEEEEEQEGSLLVSKQRKLQRSVEDGRLGGRQEMADIVKLTAVKEAALYT